MSLFAALKITMLVDGYADLPTCFAPLGWALLHQWVPNDRFDSNRVRTCIRHGSRLEGPREHTAPPTGRSSTRNVEEIGESRWESGDEWPLWHAHALAWPVEPIQ
jgi:hypothetical protein